MLQLGWQMRALESRLTAVVQSQNGDDGARAIRIRVGIRTGRVGGGGAIMFVRA